MATINVDDPQQVAMVLQQNAANLNKAIEAARATNEDGETFPAFELLIAVAQTAQLNQLALAHILRAKVNAANRRILGVRA